MRAAAFLLGAILALTLSACESERPESATGAGEAPSVHTPDTVRIFFSNSTLDPEAMDCAPVYPVQRAVPEATPRAALTALLAGPTDAEKREGWHTSLPEQARLSEVELDGSTARVDFVKLPAAGSCRVTAIRAQIESTLVSLAGVDRAAISVRGSVAEALQP